MRKVLLLTLMIKVYCVWSQDLSDIEKSNVRNNIKNISADSAKHSAMFIIAPFLFSSNVEDVNEIKKLYIAIEILNNIESDFPEDASFYKLRATAYEKIKAYKEALLDYSVAIRINPKSEVNFRDRAKCKMLSEDFHGAIVDITKCLTFLPNDDLLYGNRAWCYLMTEQWANSSIDVAKAISINNKIGFYFLTRGIIRIHFNKKNEGCTDLSKATDLGEERAFDVIQELCKTN